MAEPATLYKLIILHMLEHIDFPLSNAQISDFFLDREYTDYFTIQQVIHDLMDSGLVRTETGGHRRSGKVRHPAVPPPPDL